MASAASVGAIPGCRAHQQRVTGQRAQPLQLGADHRLRAVQAHRGAGDTAFADHGKQDLHEMEVNVGEDRTLRHTANHILS
jgi:hypothetical protein